MNRRQISQQERRGASSLASLALVLSLGCGSSKSPPPPASTQPGATEQPLAADASVVSMGDFHGRPTVQLMVGEAGPFGFILDSGASITVVDKGLAKKLGLSSEGTTEIGSPVGGTVPADKMQLRNARVDSVPLGDVPVLSIDLASVIGLADAPVGVLATAAFREKSLTFDFGGSRLLVSDEPLGPADGAETHDFCAPSGKPSVTVDVGGTKQCVNVDTGAPMILALPLSVANSLPLAEKPKVRGNARLVGAKIKTYGARLEGELRVGRIAVQNPELGFHETAPIGTLGQGFLATAEMTLDHANRRVRLRPWAPASGQPGRRVRRGPAPNDKRYGIGFRGPVDGDLDVAFVEESSPAESGGVRAGDRITTLAGVPVAELDMSARIKALTTSPLEMTVLRDGKKVALTLRFE